MHPTSHASLAAYVHVHSSHVTIMLAGHMISHDPQVSQLQQECERERQQSTRLAAQLREQQVRECMLYMLYFSKPLRFYSL